jgi:hypothetical protein
LTRSAARVLWEPGEGEDVRAGGIEVLVGVGELDLDVVQEPVELGMHGGCTGWS